MTEKEKNMLTISVDEAFGNISIVNRQLNNAFIHIRNELKYIIENDDITVYLANNDVKALLTKIVKANRLLNRLLEIRQIFDELELDIKKLREDNKDE